MHFSTFCGTKEADELFNCRFLSLWVCDPTYGTMNDDFSMYCMGGEL